MNRFEDIFDRNIFYIEKIAYERTSPQREFIVRVNNYQYLMSYADLNNFARNYKISLEKEVRGLPTVTYDNRSSWKKGLDFQMDRSVDFNSKPLCLPRIKSVDLIYFIGPQAKDVDKDKETKTEENFER